MNKQFIYTLVDPNNQDIKYVGKTSNPVVRLQRHIQISKKYENSNKSRWIKSLLEINKKPLMEIIEECNDNNVNDLEIYWISQMEAWGFNLLNINPGGERWCKNHTEESKLKIKKAHFIRSVIHYKLSGEIISKYESLSEANQKTGIHTALIHNCCRKKGSYTVNGGHFWRSENEKEPTTFRYEGDAFEYIPYNKNIQTNSKKICQYNLDGKLVETFDSLRSASDKTKIERVNISRCCKNKFKKSTHSKLTNNYINVGGYTWRYFEETNGGNLI